MILVIAAIGMLPTKCHADGLLMVDSILEVNAANVEVDIITT